MGFLIGCVIGGTIMTVIVGGLAAAAIDGITYDAFQAGKEAEARRFDEESFDWSRP